MKAKDTIRLKGFFRVKIVDSDGSLAGDSGWNRNTIVNLGFNDFIACALGSLSGSKYVGSAALGTGTAPNVTSTALPNEIGSRTSVSAATTGGTGSASKHVVFTGTFASGWHTSSSPYNISNIGLYNGTSSGGQLFAGNTFSSSACASNQAVNYTYEIGFA